MVVLCCGVVVVVAVIVMVSHLSCPNHVLQTSFPEFSSNILT